jgi:hypothetical protein
VATRSQKTHTSRAYVYVRPSSSHRLHTGRPTRSSWSRRTTRGRGAVPASGALVK